MNRQSITSSQWILAGVAVAIGLAGALYRLLVLHRLEQTAALFIGLPALLAVFLALTPRAASATGIILKGTTIALLLCGPILAEGFICVLMAAPLFYLIGIIIGLVIDRGRRKQTSVTLQALALLPIFVCALEGTTPGLTFDTREQVTVTKIVAGAPADVEHALAQTVRFDTPLPRFFRLKFPLPVAAAGDGLTIGAPRVIHFAGGEGKPGDLTLRVTDREPQSVTFAALSDTSHIAHWMTWRSSRVTWHAVAPDRTQVEWTVTYDRELDPGWYFGPWERYATSLAAQFLIDNVATPRRRS
jgi:hypothetical protein